jgi:hypothetical protein
MTGFDDDRNTSGFKDFIQSKSDLLGQALLELQAPSKHVGDACQLGKANDSTGGNIANVHLQT